jgi:hypothetical protein
VGGLGAILGMPFGFLFSLAIVVPISINAGIMAQREKKGKDTTKQMEFMQKIGKVYFGTLFDIAAAPMALFRKTHHFIYQGSVPISSYHLTPGLYKKGYEPSETENEKESFDLSKSMSRFYGFGFKDVKSTEKSLKATCVRHGTPNIPDGEKLEASIILKVEKRFLPENVLKINELNALLFCLSYVDNLLSPDMTLYKFTYKNM